VSLQHLQNWSWRAIFFEDNSLLLRLPQERNIGADGILLRMDATGSKQGKRKNGDADSISLAQAFLPKAGREAKPAGASSRSHSIANPHYFLPQPFPSD
jgi:hypothetical protein